MNSIILRCPICGNPVEMKNAISANNTKMENVKEYLIDTNTKFLCPPCEIRINKAMEILKEHSK